MDEGLPCLGQTAVRVTWETVCVFRSVKVGEGVCLPVLEPSSTTLPKGPKDRRSRRTPLPYEGLASRYSPEGPSSIPLVLRVFSPLPFGAGNGWFYLPPFLHLTHAITPKPTSTSVPGIRLTGLGGRGGVTLSPCHFKP